VTPVTEISRGWVRAFAPASVSNLTCGFDLLGYAIEGWGDVVEARRTTEPGVRLLEITGDDDRLPTDPRENSAGIAALALLERCTGTEHAVGVEIRLQKGLPLASGLGSSGASGVAAAVAVNAALQLDADLDALLSAAVEGERAASGAAHLDNVAPALHGGLVLVRPDSSPRVTRLPVPDDLVSIILHPHAEVRTRAARAALPPTVPLSTLTIQAGNLAALVTGLLRGDFDLIASAMVDHVAEPVRIAMTPGFDNVRRAALDAGALGCGLSGSGPTIFAWSRGLDGAGDIEKAMRQALRSATDLEGETKISTLNAPGARLLPNNDTPPHVR
jgi:homoserine kinase